MAQFVRPVSDLQLGTWAGQPLDPNIYQNIDEVVADDADLIATSSLDTQVAYRATGTDVTDPAVSTGHVLRWRYAKAGQKTTNIRLILQQGATSKVIRQFNGIGTAFVQDTYALTAAEADSLTDYNDLNFSVVASFPGEGTETEAYLSWVELEIPDAPPTVVVGAGGPARILLDVERRDFAAVARLRLGSRSHATTSTRASITHQSLAERFLQGSVLRKTGARMTATGSLFKHSARIRKQTAALTRHTALVRKLQGSIGYRAAGEANAKTGMQQHVKAGVSALGRLLLESLRLSRKAHGSIHASKTTEASAIGEVEDDLDMLVAASEEDKSADES